MPRPRRAARLLPALALGLAASCGGEAEAPGDGAAAAGEDALADVPAGARVAATVVFPRPVTDSTAVAFLQSHSLHPFAVYLALEGLTGVHREPRGDASLEVVGRAKQEAAPILTNAACAQQGRAAALLEGEELPPAADLSPLRRLLADLARLDRALTALPAGAPAIYAVEVVGTPYDVRRVRGVAGGPDVLLGDDPGEEGAPPAPPPEESRELPPEIAGLSREALLARAAELAGRGLEDCHDYPASRPR